MCLSAFRMANVAKITIVSDYIHRNQSYFVIFLRINECVFMNYTDCEHFQVKNKNYIIALVTVNAVRYNELTSIFRKLICKYSQNIK